MKNIEFTYALYCYTKEHAEKGKRVGVASFITFVREHRERFPALSTFIENVNEEDYTSCEDEQHPSVPASLAVPLAV
jgi:hypothetical protein